MNDVLDLDALRHLRTVIGGDTDDLMELVDDFITTLPQQMADMQVQAENGDLAALRITAHSCKSNARDLGALGLSALCAELERNCAEGQAAQILSLVGQIQTEGQRAQNGYASLEPGDV